MNIAPNKKSKNTAVNFCNFIASVDNENRKKQTIILELEELGIKFGKGGE